KRRAGSSVFTTSLQRPCRLSLSLPHDQALAARVGAAEPAAGRTLDGLQAAGHLAFAYLVAACFQRLQAAAREASGLQHRRAVVASEVRKIDRPLRIQAPAIHAEQGFRGEVDDR